MQHPETWDAIRKLIAFRNQAPSLVPRLHSGDLPLSFPQERLWFLQQLNSRNASFNIPHVLRLTGVLDVEALQHSLNELRRRHAVLRTLFKTEGRQRTVQEVLTFEPVALEQITLSHLAVSEREGQITRLISAKAQQPFDLRQEAGFRACLLLLGNQEHILLLVFHHIVFDFWSQSIVLRDLQALYTKAIGNQDTTLPNLPIEYADFAVWQQAWLGKAAVREPLLAYWQSQLEGLTALRLPTNHSSAGSQSRRAGLQTFTLSSQLTTALHAFVKQERDTLFTALCAGFKLLLQGYTGQDDIFIGSLMANRNRHELNHLIGNFVNLLVLRTNLSGHITFREAVARVRQVMAGAIAHQDLPVQFLNAPIRLVQVVFAFRNTPQHKLDLPNLTVEVELLESGDADFDLFFDLIKDGSSISGRVTYNCNLFADETITQMLTDFEALLSIVVAEPDKPSAQLLSGLRKISDLLAHTAPHIEPSKQQSRKLASSTASNRSTAPQTDMERQLAEVWQSTLGISQVDIHRTFFDLGGNSLLLLQAHQKLQAVFSGEIAPVHLFQYPTIHELAQYLSKTSVVNVDTSRKSDSVQEGHERAQRKRAARRQRRSVRRRQSR